MPGRRVAVVLAEEKYIQVIQYHNQTKHSFHQSSRSLGYMDWPNQPLPYRLYRGAPLIKLPLSAHDPENPHLNLFCRTNTQPQEYSIETLAKLIELSLGLSSWKQAGNSRWALRMNPSSGNLHPTESYWILPATEKSGPGLYHYNPLLHTLQQLQAYPADIVEMLDQSRAPSEWFVALSSIFWRESWKYGERAFRYCQLDTGHALASLSLAANLLGWQLTLQHSISDQDLEKLLGFDHIPWLPMEKDEVQCLCKIQFTGNTTSNEDTSKLSALPITSPLGIPEPLSANHHPWDIIDTIADATRKPTISITPVEARANHSLSLVQSQWSAAEIIRNRRSGTDFNPEDSMMSIEIFYSILAATLPLSGNPPFDLWSYPASVNLLLFVHRIKELEPGLYFLLRTQEDHDTIAEHFHDTFSWNPASGHLPLYCLTSGNFKSKAAELSCGQDIAGDGSFSLGMLCNFSESLQASTYRYRQLYWEAGMIGQVLYLQAEAYGFRGTGIGCFFDDPVHEFAGIFDYTYQSIYHFTIGSPVSDSRLLTLPAYYHLK